MKKTLVGLAIAFGFLAVFLSFQGIHGVEDEEDDFLDEDDGEEFHRSVRRVLDQTQSVNMTMQQLLKGFYAQRFKWYTEADEREKNKTEAAKAAAAAAAAAVNNPVPPKVDETKPGVGDSPPDPKKDETVTKTKK